MSTIAARRQAGWAAVHSIGQRRLVAATALPWFVLLGLLPLPYLRAHAIVPAIVPVALLCVLVCGLLVGDVAWHYAKTGFEEGAGAASARLVARRRRTLSRFVFVPLVLPSMVVFFDTGPRGEIDVVVGVLGALVVLTAALILLERSMKRAA